MGLLVDKWKCRLPILLSCFLITVEIYDKYFVFMGLRDLCFIVST